MMNFGFNGWMVHADECACIKCSSWRKHHTKCVGERECYYCWTRRVLREDGELVDEPLVPEPLVP